MLFLYVVLVTGCAAILVGGVLEQRRHTANLARIPSRVLVNGIRGKSSITRLTAGALRGGGLTTVAKTTGSAARFIYPDAAEEPVHRKFDLANIVEQIAIVRRAACYRPDALVIECMAVMPDLQEINQEKLVRSTIGVLSNAREDHLTEMGPTVDDVARSLCRSMPIGGVCITTEQERLPILADEADLRDCQLIPVDPESVTDEEMAPFTWITFKENVAIALKVAELHGVSREDALNGMWAAPPDPGVVTVARFDVEGRTVRFANVFAANDPESTITNIELLSERGLIERPLHLVINCRPDRVERNAQMGALVEKIDPDRVLLIGEPTRSARNAIAEGWQDRVVELGGRRSPAELRDAAVDHPGESFSLVAVGNIHGQGEILIDALDVLPRHTRPGPATSSPAPARAISRSVTATTTATVADAPALPDGGS